jgi:hypothetical protein
MGSSSLNADVNAFERLQMVRGLNSSYSVRSRVHGRSGRDVSAFQFAFDECLVDDHFYRDIGQLTFAATFPLAYAYRLEVALHSIHSDRNAIDQRERLRGEFGTGLQQQMVQDFLVLQGERRQLMG